MEASPLPLLGDDRTPRSTSSAAGGEDSKINIYLKVTKTVALKVEKTEKIENLKALLHEKEKISEYVPEFFFVGNQLKNGRSLVDYGIEKNSTLHALQKPLVGQKIFVKTPSKQKTVEIEATTYDTIQNIKSKIQMKEGIESDRCTLVCNGTVLEDDQTLASVSMESQSTFHMVFSSKDILSFFVKAPNGETVKLKLKACFTAGDVKEIVGGMVLQPVTSHILAYAGVQLEDHKILACYNIEEGSMLAMVPPRIQIFVKTWSGETITLDVRQGETIEDIKGNIVKKLKIRDRCSFPKYASLVYGGKRLEEKRDLADYDIQKHSTLRMVISPSSKVIERNVAVAAGSPMPSSTKISCLKAMIGDKMQVPVQQLLFRGVLMADDRTMAYYGMDSSSQVTISVIPWSANG